MVVIVLWSFNGNAVYIWDVAATAGHTKMVTLSMDFLDPKFWMEMTLWGICLGMLITPSRRFWERSGFGSTLSRGRVGSYDGKNR